MKRVYQFNEQGELQNSYKSLAEAARAVGVSKETISKVLNGKRNTAAGSLWSFSDKITVEKYDDVEWRDIKGFEGLYQMSENREVRKLPHTVTQTVNGITYTRRISGHKIVQGIDVLGYLYVSLNGENYRIHWLFYNTFIGDSSGYVIDHIDRNKLNNDPSNLRLLTQKGNVYNRTMPYKPDIQDCSKYQVYKNKENSHPYLLRFGENGVRKRIGYFKTYEEAENKYRELYEERQKRIDASSKVFTINS